ncbi:MAG TPA: DsrE family protein [Pyrinomonadaceae bacterium]|nr:DsrE family protein [Pyrinomonadaceae bacterium]
MTRYLFIESRDPFESRDTFIEDTATALKQRGHDVTVFLIQNGVLAARKNAQRLGRLSQAGITLLVDDFSLCERGIQPAELTSGIQQATVDTLVEALVNENTKAIWH